MHLLPARMLGHSNESEVGPNCREPRGFRSWIACSRGCSHCTRTHIVRFETYLLWYSAQFLRLLVINCTTFAPRRPVAIRKPNSSKLK